MSKPVFSFGIIADCQYADIEDSHVFGDRQFRSSLGKLQESIDFFNRHNLAFVVHLGDLIDQDIKSFDTVVPICDQSKAPFLHVLGNHDFADPGYVYGQQREAVLHKLKLESPYYSREFNGWRFIILDGNDEGIIEWPESSEEWRRGKALLDALAAKGRVNAQPWNGAIGAIQLAWLEKELVDAKTKNQPVILFCHQPIFPEHRENLLNDKEMLRLFAADMNVKAFINGHNHDGNYGEYKGLPCLTIHGMLDTAENAYALAHVYNDRIEIEGYGREPKRTLTIRG